MHSYISLSIFNYLSCIEMAWVIHVKAAAQYVHNTIRNPSMAVTNMIGPVEKMALSNQPVKGLYFMVVNSPQVSSIFATIYIISTPFN